MDLGLNELAWSLVDDLMENPEDFRILIQDLAEGGTIIDMGISTEGGLDAGMMMATICMAGLADVYLAPGTLSSWHWPHVTVQTDFPVPACLYSQYAGWKLEVGKFYGMGSGPMRAAAAHEPLFDRLWYRERSDKVVGIVETASLPTEEVFAEIAQKTGVSPSNIVLLVAPTSSFVGNYQVTARSVETALHKLLELGFDVHRVRSAYGVAPLPPVARNDLEGIGRTNDAILYGGRVTLWVTGDDESLAEIVPHIPSQASPMHGQTFLEVFETAGRDFYRIDPLLFSPAEVVVHNLETGRVHVSGQVRPDILLRSFGLS
ncbi:MAG: methenyltetrahydromethanopterin cyclohydrolase [Planctomycetaceae bacterium]|nr:MAG: methenyltetrahydromethanopterin cyclohydrolase [Planctomycetaceae bacterium]